MQILLYFSAFVTIFEWFLGLMIQLAEWMFWILNSLRYYFHYSFHNTTHVEQRLTAFNLPCWLTANRFALSIRPNGVFVIQNFPKYFLAN